ncbi:hypothetical protein ACOXXX_02440 [Thalassococcus sp. BH17M4-6]|uniref:hypothetical protein n=1 Tax=Thalassococcus sp. BH17M4-6 TaxID=3413148 RepID=UPI003BBA6DEB
MQKQISKIVRNALILLSFCSFVSIGGVAEAQDREIAVGDFRAIEAMGDVLFSQEDRTTTALREAGYRPLVDSAMWKDFSPTRKIETAYLEAEEARQGAGETFLRKLAHVAAGSSEGLRVEPDIAAYLKDPPPSENVEFKRLQHTPTASEIPNDIIPRILTLVDAISHGAMGGPRRVAKFHLGLTDRQIYEAFRTSNSAQEGLWKAIHMLACPPCQQRLAELARQVQIEYEGARSEKSLNDLVGRYLYSGDTTVGPWNEMRARLEQVVLEGDIRLEPEKVAHMQDAVRDWQNERAKIAERWIKSGMTPSAQLWEKEFFDYTQRNPQMAALWGFAIISFETDSLVFESTMRAYISETLTKNRSETREGVVEALRNNGMTSSQIRRSSDLVDAVANLRSAENWFDSLISEGFLTSADKRAAEYFDPRLEGVNNNRNYSFQILLDHASEWYTSKVGPKPADGYQHYSRRMGFLSESDSLKYFRSDAVNDWVDRMCPK